MKRYFLLSIIALWAIPLSAQTLDSLLLNQDIFETLNTTGIYGNRITLVQTDMLKSAVQNQIVQNGSKKMQGWRIRIFTSNAQTARTASQTIKEEFESIFPHFRAHITYNNIDYRVVVGDFRTKSEAVRFRNELMALPQYRDRALIVVREAIEFPDL